MQVLFCEWLAYSYSSRWIFDPVSWDWAKPHCLRQVQGMSESSSPRLPKHCNFSGANSHGILDGGTVLSHEFTSEVLQYIHLQFTENMNSLIRCSENNSVFTKTTVATHSAQHLKYCCLHLASEISSLPSVQSSLHRENIGYNWMLKPLYCVFHATLLYKYYHVLQGFHSKVFYSKSTLLQNTQTL